MQAGKQRAVLPLIRKFNEHSSRLLNTVLCVFCLKHPNCQIDLDVEGNRLPKRDVRMRAPKRSAEIQLLTGFTSLIFL